MRAVASGLTASLLATALLCTPARAENAARLNGQLDLAPTDGQLNEAELKLGIVHRRSRLNLPALRALEPKPRREAVVAILKAAEFQDEASDDAASLQQLYLDHGLEAGQASYPLDRIDPAAFGLRAMLEPGPAGLAAQPQRSRAGAALRRSKEQVLKALREPATDYEVFTEGALLNYRRDREENVNSVNFTGTLGLSWQLGPNEFFDPKYVAPGAEKPAGQTAQSPGPLLSRELYLLGTVDRADNDREVPLANRGKAASNPKEKDTVEFEFGLADTYSWGRRIRKGATNPADISRLGKNALGLLGLGVSGGLTYNTDSEFRRAIWAGNLTFSPVWGLPGMDAWQGVWKLRDRYGRSSYLLGYRFSLSAGIVGGTVEEEGSDDFDRQEDGFLYAGFQAALDVEILPTLLSRRLALRASYAQYEGLLSGVEGTQDFRASLRYYLQFPFGFARLQKAGGVKGEPAVLEPGALTWALELAYRHGQDPISLEVDHSLTLGASVAF